MLMFPLLLSTATAICMALQPRYADSLISSNVISPDLPTGTASRWLLNNQKVRGVNLGSQFIVEPWMAYDEWTSMGCGNMEDEWSCVDLLGQDRADAVFAKHWSSWITANDIQKISAHGLNVVRIPVGFWINEDLVENWEHFPRGGLQHLDVLVESAANFGLHVILDLHGGPGSQAANQTFTGHKTSSPNFYNPHNFERSLQFLEWMTNRIHTLYQYRSVGVIEVMNEPVSQNSFPNLIEDMIEDFYPEAYRRIRVVEAKLNIPIRDQLKIQYMSKRWGSGDPMKYMPRDATNVLFDDHLYYSFDPALQTKEQVLSAVCSSFSTRKNTIVGEWSLSVGEGVADPIQEKEWYKTYWATQRHVYEQAGGWIFWTWKCNWISGREEWRWCYESAVANGIIPKMLYNSSPGSCSH